MRNVTTLLPSVKQFIDQNAPAILTAFGAVGVVGTAVLAGKASFEACDKIRETEEQLPLGEDELTRNEKIKLVWPLYIPAVVTGTTSVAAVVMSHRISSKRAAALAAAYALNQEKFDEYQEKIKEKLGVKKEKDARDEIHQERVNQISDAGFMFANPMTGKVWIMEAYTGRPFLSTVEDVKRAVNEINHEIENAGSVRLSDFYDAINHGAGTTLLAHVATSDHFGFTHNNRMELDWTTTTSPDGSLAVHVFDYVNHPVMDPEREASFR